MYQLLDLTSWNRQEHFHFFKQFSEPFFGVTVNVDATAAHAFCKEAGHSFFLFYLHAALVAANSVEPFRYRIHGEEVRVYDQINAGPTIARPDGTFAFSYLDYYPDFVQFAAEAAKEIAAVQQSSGLRPAVSGENVIHFSAMPWLKFTSVSHARHYDFPDSCPKISFGKLFEADNSLQMPVSLHAHHALMDGLHAAQFIEAFQHGLRNPTLG